MQEKKTKTVTAVHGHLTVQRRYRYCTQCSQYSFPIDTILGMSTGITERLQRVAARCCGLWSYRLAADTLKELCGANLSHTTIGTIAGHTADEMSARLLNNPDVRKDFQKAKGEIELYAVGVFVHIRNDAGKAEWREFKVGAFAKRVRSRRNGALGNCRNLLWLLRLRRLKVKTADSRRQFAADASGV